MGSRVEGFRGLRFRAYGYGSITWRRTGKVTWKPVLCKGCRDCIWELEVP